jgi:hypothetical protein
MMSELESQSHLRPVGTIEKDILAGHKVAL